MPRLLQKCEGAELKLDIHNGKKMNRHTHAEITKQSLKRNSVNATSISSLLLPCILNWKLLKSNNYHVNGFHHGRWLDSTKSGTIHCSLKKRKKKEKKMLIQPVRPTLCLTHYLLNSKPKIHFRYIPAKNDYFYKLWMFSVSETTECCSWNTGGALHNSDMMDKQKWGKNRKRLTLSYCPLPSSWQKSRVCSLPLPTIKVAEFAPEQ